MKIAEYFLITIAIVNGLAIFMFIGDDRIVVFDGSWFYFTSFMVSSLGLIAMYFAERRKGRE
ncbi:MAG: hypothetical protein EOP83_00330 [Verrucomicrobiaceae bacterium]|nr:MAG: hypothetical protein EOP83_00330 [Verrucomicrobiaceae bacterium]